MPTQAEIRQKLIGEVLPYVFIESVVLDKAPPMRSEDMPRIGQRAPMFTRNEYGNNKLSVNQGTLDSRDDSQVHKISLKISMNDLLNNSSWFNTSARSAMKIKIFQATSEKAFNLISSANFHDLRNAPDSTRRHIRERIISIPNEKTLDHYAVRQIDGFDDTLCTIKIRQDFIVKSNYVGFVAFPYVEVPPLYGAKNSQKVLANGKLNTKSYTYYSPDGSLWKGPVHMHPERGLMEGRVHTERAHSLLTVVEHENKVNDLRIFDKFSSLQHGVSLRKEQSVNKKYSDLLLTGDSGGLVRGFFAFDYVGFLSDNTEYNGLVNRRNVKKLMNLTNIESLSIFRDAINDYEAGEAIESNIITKTSPDRVTLATYNAPRGRNVRVPTTVNTNFNDGQGHREKTVGSTREVVVSGLGNKRAFAFVDHDIASAINGTYVYGAEIKIKDPTPKLLKIQLLALREARKTILSYYEEARQGSNFNKTTGELTHEYVSYLRKVYNLDIRTKGARPKRVYTPWRSAPKIYFNALETLLGRRIPKTDKKALQKALYPSTGNLEGVERFISLLDSLITQIGVHEPVVSEAKSRTSGKHGAKPKDNILRSEKLFEAKPWRKTKIDGAGYRLNYLQGALRRNENNLVQINRGSLINRFNVEANKFFPEVIGKRENQISNPDLKGFRKTYFSHLSPTTMETKNENIIISKKNEQSYDKVSRILNGQGQELGSDALSMELLKNLGATVKRRDTGGNTEATLTDASDYFGPNSNVTKKTSNKDSGQDPSTDSVGSDPMLEKIRNTLAGRKSRDTSENNEINKNDSLQRRYIKLLRRNQENEDQKAEADVLDQTTASVKYINGFDSR